MLKKNASIAGGILVRGLRNLPNQIEVVLDPLNIMFTMQVTYEPEHRIRLKNLVNFGSDFGVITESSSIEQVLSKVHFIIPFEVVYILDCINNILNAG